MKNNMTALVSCFARYYHTVNSNIKIYNDTLAPAILTKSEIENISKNMMEGIKFFNPNYDGDDSLKWVVNNILAPSVLARSIFNEKHLLSEIRLGLKQYLILGSGYDTSGYKISDKVSVYELDKKEMIEDKVKRVKNANINTKNINYISCDFNSNWIENLLKSSFDKNKKTFCSLLGLSYYLDKEIFKQTISILSKNIPAGSVIVFDYPSNIETKKEIINQALAKEAVEEMKSKYSYKDIEAIAQTSNMLIYEHLNYQDINDTFFYDYNTLNPSNKILAPKGVAYCLLVKQ